MGVQPFALFPFRWRYLPFFFLFFGFDALCFATGSLLSGPFSPFSGRLGQGLTDPFLRRARDRDDFSGRPSAHTSAAIQKGIPSGGARGCGGMMPMRTSLPPPQQGQACGSRPRHRRSRAARRTS